jgi:hypothetical protein
MMCEGWRHRCVGSEWQCFTDEITAYENMKGDEPDQNERGLLT